VEGFQTERLCGFGAANARRLRFRVGEGLLIHLEDLI
jgi:hypothetical protein